MALTSVFVCFYPGVDVSIGTLSDRISRVAGRNVSRVDYVRGSTGRYCFVHFDREMPEALWNIISAGQETIDTVEGPIRIGVNRSNGLDPNTADEITQFMTTASGTYWRDYKSGVVRKMNIMGWLLTEENPFVSEISEVEMEDAFTPAVTAQVAEMDQELDDIVPSNPPVVVKTTEEIGLRRALFV
jgi:hypothetical protein